MTHASVKLDCLDFSSHVACAVRCCCSKVVFPVWPVVSVMAAVFGACGCEMLKSTYLGLFFMCSKKKTTQRQIGN